MRLPTPHGRYRSLGSTLLIAGFSAALCGCAEQRPWRPFASLSREKPSVKTPADRIEELVDLSERADQLPPAEQERYCQEMATELAQSNDPLLRAAIIRAVARFPTTTAGVLLDRGLADSDQDVRVAACEGWTIRGGAEAVAKLAELLNSDTDLDVRLAAARGLGEIGDPTAQTALALALDDPNPAMQHRAVQSLRAVTGKELPSVAAWQDYLRTGTEPPPPTLAERARDFF